MPNLVEFRARGVYPRDDNGVLNLATVSSLKHLRSFHVDTCGFPRSDVLTDLSLRGLTSLTMCDFVDVHDIARIVRENRFTLERLAIFYRLVLTEGNIIVTLNLPTQISS